MATISDPSWVDLDFFKEKTTLSRSTLYRLVKRGILPKPQKIKGTRRVVWPASVVEEFLNSGLDGGAE